MTFLQVFHEYSNHNVDKHKLSHQYENDKEYWRDDAANATVLNAVSGIVTIVPECVLHNSIPIVTSGDPEQRKESHAEVAEVRVLA